MAEFASRGAGGPLDSSASANANGSATKARRKPEECCDEKDKQQCQRIPGTRPRNRQHQAQAYYFGREHLCTALVANTPLQVCQRNPYRTQLIFGFGGAAAPGVVYSLAHTLDDINAGHTSFVQFNTSPSSLILSYPLHGFLVTEEWWIVASANSGLNFTGYLYSD
jgi:hypothetical protein